MKSPFQTIIIIVFTAAFVIAVAVFSGLFSSGTSQTTDVPSGVVTVWGILPDEQMQQFVNQFNNQGNGYSISYVERPQETFLQDFTFALADDMPPDVLLLNSEILLQFKNKLYPIPYEVFSERSFRDTNVDGAQLFLTNEGTISIPLLVDPLVVYYNKDILAAANYVIPPQNWKDLADAAPILSKRASDGTITQSAIALGETINIVHFRDILSALFLQVGNPIVSYDTSINRYASQIAGGASGSTSISDVIEFFGAFSEPTSNAYTWNRSLPESLNMFVSGRLAFYIGRASELFTIQALNPNLNFDVIEFFQPDQKMRPITFGSFVGAGIVKGSSNFNAAYAFVAALSSSSWGVDTLSKLFSLPPVRRDLLTVQQPNPYVSVFFKAALSSFAWPDPNASATQTIFRDMMNNIKSGRTDIGTAINEAEQRLNENIR